MSIQKVEMTVERIENGQYVEQVAYPYVEYEHVTMENGMDIMSMIRDDVSTPMVTHNTTSWKVGQGDSDVSETIVDSSIASMTIKGQTYQNILPNPSLRNSMTIGKTMQKLNEGYDSVNTVDGVCKSAILKGNTLVNLIDRDSIKNVGAIKVVDGIITWTDKVTGWLNGKIEIEPTISIVNGKIYTLIFKCNQERAITTGFIKGGGWRPTINIKTQVGVNTVKITSTATDVNFTIQFIENTGLEIYDIILLEGDYTNVDIPYFEGMQSVKMPVLTTIGKNVFDLANSGLREESAYDKSMNIYGFWSFGVQLQPNKEVTISRKNNDGYKLGLNLKIHNENTYNGGKWLIANHAQNENKSSATITTNSDGYIWFIFSHNFDKINQILDICEYIQIEYGTVATSYEPYKTNILSCNEEVTLRGIGDVKDTLDLTTGELTQRIKEVVFDGSENWVRSADFSSLTNTIHFQIQSDTVGIEFGSPLISDKFINCIVWAKDIEGISCATNGNLAISINRDKLSGLEVTDFKKWLSQNNVTVIGKTTESIKTVDLSILDQDNQPTTQLNSFANGYIQVSSQEGTLIPTTEYEVPTSNSYHVDLMKPNTQYTMKNMQGTFTIDGIQYNASVNGTFTSPSTLSNRLMITNVVQTQPMLLEGDMTSKEVPYVEGIKSTFEGVDKVEIVSQNADNSLSNTTSFQLAHPLRSLPNGVRDEIVLDRVNHKAKIIQRVGEDLTQLETPIITEVNLEGYPYVYKGGHIFLNTEIAPITEVKYSINQAHQIESSNEDILRHQKEINHLYELIAQYVQVQYEAELIDIALQG